MTLRKMNSSLNYSVFKLRIASKIGSRRQNRFPHNAERRSPRRHPQSASPATTALQVTVSTATSRHHRPIRAWDAVDRHFSDRRDRGLLAIGVLC
jgi:hypothetical protein